MPARNHTEIVRRLIARLRAGGSPGSWGAAELQPLLRARAGRLLVGTVAVIAGLTMIGLVGLWPYGWSASGDQRLSGVVGARITRVIDEPCTPGSVDLCRSISVRVEGRSVLIPLAPTARAPRVSAGNRVLVSRPGRTDIAPPRDQAVRYEFYDVDRRTSMLWWLLALAAAAAVVLRWRGILALVGVGLSLAVVLWFLVPAILAGRPPLLVALVGALTVMFITVTLTNGLGAQTFAAALGISATLVFGSGLATAAVHFTNLTGDVEFGLTGLDASRGLSTPAIIVAAMLISALGVLADTAVTQASAVMALRRANPAYDATRLFREAFVVGRDHLSATIHTLVLAYAGALLPLLLILRTGNVPAVEAFNRQSVAEPIIATLTGCLALIAAVPLTTGLAALLISRVPVVALPDAHHHHQH